MLFARDCEGSEPDSDQMLLYEENGQQILERCNDFFFKKDPWVEVRFYVLKKEGFMKQVLISKDWSVFSHSTIMSIKITCGHIAKVAAECFVCV